MAMTQRGVESEEGERERWAMKARRPALQQKRFSDELQQCTHSHDIGALLGVSS